MIKKVIPLTLLALSMQCAHALPSGAEVVHGEAQIAASQAEANNTLIVNQTSHAAIINWQDFNVAKHEVVSFNQPTNGSCLNRINSANGMSIIDGQINSNATIFLINEAGVLFNDSASLNVGSIIASTIDISNDNFFKEKMQFDGNNSGWFSSWFNADKRGAVINRGNIVASPEGLVALLGSSAVNVGVIKANMGSVILDSGKSVTIDFFGSDVIRYDIQPVTAPGVDEHGQALPDGVQISGTITGENVGIFVGAKAAQGVFDNLINIPGEIRATSIANEHGVIILKGDGVGTVKVTGTLDVSSADNFTDAGTILISGQDIVIDEKAKLLATADIGDGNIIVGVPEGFGAGLNLPVVECPATYTQKVYVGSDVTINANAHKNGDGGTVLVSSTDETTFLGTASARGGNVSGDGGTIVIYSLNSLGATPVDSLRLDSNATHGQSLKPYVSQDPQFIQLINANLLKNTSIFSDI